MMRAIYQQHALLRGSFSNSIRVILLSELDVGGVDNLRLSRAAHLQDLVKVEVVHAGLRIPGGARRAESFYSDSGVCVSRPCGICSRGPADRLKFECGR